MGNVAYVWDLFKKFSCIEKNYDREVDKPFEV